MQVEVIYPSGNMIPFIIIGERLKLGSQFDNHSLLFEFAYGEIESGSFLEIVEMSEDKKTIWVEYFATE